MFVVLAYSLPALANQRETHLNAMKNFENQAQVNLQNSTVEAMRALLSYESGNFAKAKEQGESSYRMYQQAVTANVFADGKQMDAITSRSKTDIRELYHFSPRKTTYQNIDPLFLESGEAAAVAKKFEAATGMSRGTFLKELSSATDNPITDANPFPKAIARFKVFLSKIPNQSFRKKVERSVYRLPADYLASSIKKSLINAMSEKKNGSAVAAASSSSAVADTKPSYKQPNAAFEQKEIVDVSISEKLQNDRDSSETLLRPIEDVRLPTFHKVAAVETDIWSDRELLKADSAVAAMIKVKKEEGKNKSLFAMIRKKIDDVELDWVTFSHQED